MEGVPRSSGALHTMSSWSADPSARGRRARERVKVLSFITQVHIGERDTINIDTQLRDAIITLVDPLPLCSPDCAGLCDVCGDKWADLPADHEHFVVDPRLASLASLLDEHTEPGRS